MQQNEKFPRRLAAIPRQQTLFERYSGLPDLSRLGLIGDAVNEALKEVQAPPPLTLLVCLVAASTATQSLYDAYSRPRLPLIPDEACHPFHAKAATDSTAKLPPWQAA